MSILDDLKLLADAFDDEGDMEMSKIFVQCIAEIRKLRAALEPLAEIDLLGTALPSEFAFHVLRARDALKTPNVELRGAKPVGEASGSAQGYAARGDNGE